MTWTLLPWQNYQVEDKGYKQVHLVPINDLGPHRLCEHCACEPVEDTQAPDYWVHNAYDQRERYGLGALLH